LGYSFFGFDWWHQLHWLLIQSQAGPRTPSHHVYNIPYTRIRRKTSNINQLVLSYMHVADLIDTTGAGSLVQVSSRPNRMHRIYLFTSLLKLLATLLALDKRSTVASTEVIEAAASVVFHSSCLEKLKIIPVNSKNDKHKENSSFARNNKQHWLERPL